MSSMPQRQRGSKFVWIAVSFAKAGSGVPGKVELLCVGAQEIVSKPSSGAVRRTPIAGPLNATVPPQMLPGPNPHS